MSFITILQKKRKTIDDAQFISHKLSDMPFFKGFYNRNLKTLCEEHQLSLFQFFQYESIPSGTYLFQRGNISDKFYVLLSGQAVIIDPNEKNTSFTGKTVAKRSPKVLDYNIPIIPELKIDGNHDSSVILEEISTERLVKTPNSSRPESPVIQRSIKPSQTLSPLYSKLLEEKLKNERHSLPRLSEESLSLLIKEESQIKSQALNSYDDLLHHEKHKQYDLDLRKFVFFVKQGEGVGELALNNDFSRTASVYCKTDCEVVVLNKAHFDLVKIRRDRQKEDFLKSVFPFLNDRNISPFNYSRILTAFQTEAYNKGVSITREGKFYSKETRLYLLSQGECVIEKNLTIGDRIQPIQIAVVGKGTLIGEEILITLDEYHYTVRAITDTVIVHSISTNFLELGFCKFFKQEITKTYEKKKKQRDFIFEKSKKEYETRNASPSNANILSPKAAQLKLYYSKALESPNKEKKILNESLLLLKFPKISRDLSYNQDISASNITKEDERASPDSPVSIVSKTVRAKKKILKLLESKNVSRNKVESKIEFATSSPSKEKPDFSSSIELNNIRLFDTKRKSIKAASPSPKNGPTTNISNNSQSPGKTKQYPVKLVLNEFAKISAKFGQFEQDLVDIKYNQREGSPIEGESLQYLAGLSNPPSPTHDLRKKANDEINTMRGYQPTSPTLRSYNSRNDGFTETPSCNIDLIPQEKEKSELHKKSSFFNPNIFSTTSIDPSGSEQKLTNIDDSPREYKEKRYNKYTSKGTIPDPSIHDQRISNMEENKRDHIEKRQCRSISKISRPVLNKLTLELDVRANMGSSIHGKSGFTSSQSPLPNNTNRSLNMSPVPRFQTNESLNLSQKSNAHKLYKRGPNNMKLLRAKRVSLRPLGLQKRDYN